MKCKHPYYEIKDGILVCHQCGEPSPNQSGIEDKMQGRQENKTAPLYVSDKDKAPASGEA
jgi:uncharacterized Zn finger protein (UPF0148 family)